MAQWRKGQERFEIKMNGKKRHINGDDKELFREISSFLRAKADIEDVMNDPALSGTRDSVKEMISDYKKNVAEKGSSKKNENYLKESLSETVYNKTKKDDFTDFKDFTDSDISLVTADWVKEWHRQKQSSTAPDPKAEERKEFITSSLKAEPAEVHEVVMQTGKKGISRSLFIRYITLSAAAVIGAVIMISSLLPSSADKLFNSYYTPFDAISPVTRNASGSIDEIYASAILSYKSGDYKSANAGFAEANLKNPASEAPLFYMGLTNIELGNLSQAVNELSSVASGSGEYVKDAEWYLGMAYLKSGDKLKAAECFGKLAEAPGYYRNPSEKLLRHLK
jgi:TolA-binding protein